jgi:hypothetical protein
MFTDDGYMSTSILERGNWSGNIEMQIDVPKGTMCRWVDDGLTSCPGENELTLGRGQTMIITGVEDDPVTKRVIVHLRIM